MSASDFPVRPVGGVLRAGILAAVVAVLGNVVIYLVSNLLKISFTVPTPTEPFTVTIANVVVETLLLAAVATLVFALLSRRSRRADSVFRVMAVVVLLISLVFPLLLNSGPPMKIALALMHIFSAAVIVTLLTRSQAGRPAGRPLR